MQKIENMLLILFQPSKGFGNAILFRVRKRSTPGLFCLDFTWVKQRPWPRCDLNLRRTCLCRLS